MQQWRRQGGPGVQCTAVIMARTLARPVRNICDWLALPFSHGLKAEHMLACRYSWVQLHTCVCSAWPLWDKMKSFPGQDMLLCLKCFLPGYCLLENTCKKRHMYQQVLSVLSPASPRMAMHICVHRTNIPLKSKAPWLVSGEWLGWRGDSYWRELPLWKGGRAGLQHGGAQRVREEEASPFCGSIEVGRRPAVNKLQMWGTKGQVSRPSLHLFLSREDGEVSGCNPVELPSTACIY